MLGKIGYEQNEPYFNEEEYNMMLAVDPNFKDRYEVKRNEEEADIFKQYKSETDVYNSRLPLSGYVSNTLDSNTLDSKKIKKDIKGGFPFLAMIPLLSSVLPEVIKGVSGLIRGRGSGSAINMLKDFVSQNQNALIEAEKDIVNSHPKDAWKKLLDTTKSIASELVGDERAGEQAVQKIVPKGFLKVLGSKKQGGLGRSLNNSDLAEPVLRYSLNKLIGDPSVAKQVMQQLKPQLRSGAGVYGGKLNFGKIFGIVKKGLKSALPIISKITGAVVDVGAKPLIKGLLGKFGVKNDAVVEAISNVGKDLLKKGTEEMGKGMTLKQDSLSSSMPMTKDRFKLGSDGGFTSPPGRGFTRPPGRSARGGEEKKKTSMKIKFI